MRKNVRFTAHTHPPAHSREHSAPSGRSVRAFTCRGGEGHRSGFYAAPGEGRSFREGSSGVPAVRQRRGEPFDGCRSPRPISTLHDLSITLQEGFSESRRRKGHAGPWSPLGNSGTLMSHSNHSKTRSAGCSGQGGSIRHLPSLPSHRASLSGNGLGLSPLQYVINLARPAVVRRTVKRCSCVLIGQNTGLH